MCQGSLCRRWPGQLPPCPTTQGQQAFRSQPVPGQVSRAPWASLGRGASLGPSPSLPPCFGDPRRPSSHCGGPAGPRHAASLTFASRPGPRRPPATPASASPRSARSRRQEQRPRSRAAGGCSKTPRALRGSCGFSLPPTAARLRPILPLPANHKPARRSGSAHPSPPSGPSDQMFRQKESNPENIVLDALPSPGGLKAASAFPKEARGRRCT